MKKIILTSVLASIMLLTACPPPPSASYTLMDVHGAGAQRSDPKSGNPADYPYGHGPQGDVIRIYNLARLVRGDTSTDKNYAIVDTNQTTFFDDTAPVSPITAGNAFYGQDANFSGLQPNYDVSGDTVTDNNTGLMWEKGYSKVGYTAGETGAASCTTGGHNDWRLPTIKELYSLIIFSGKDCSGYEGATDSLVPFIDTDNFDFEYGDTSAGERIIDVQYMSSTVYVSTTMNGDATVFGVNFADGRIKGYPQVDAMTMSDKTFFVKYVRLNTNYGTNNFTDNSDLTITDNATGLMWMQQDSGHLSAGSNSDGKMNWQEALAWVDTMNTSSYLGYSDWRLPDAKEMQSIVDYSKSPDFTSSAAIDTAYFNCTSITDEGGNTNYAFYWSGTTHEGLQGGGNAAYVAFGEALGFMTDSNPLLQ